MVFIEKSWGYENWLVNNELYCAKHLICYKDRWSSKGKYHYHKHKDETFFILMGRLLLDIEGVEYDLTKGDKKRIKPNERHRFKATTEYCKVLEVSTHHDESDSYRIDEL